MTTVDDRDDGMADMAILTSKDPVDEKYGLAIQGRCGAEKSSGTGLCMRKAGWGTHHLGRGHCIEHGSDELHFSEPYDNSYAQFVSSTKLRRIIQQFERGENTLSLSGELAVLKAMLAYGTEQLGSSVRIDEQGNLLVEHDAVGLNEQMKDLLKVIREISVTVKSIASIEQTVRDYIPREQVRQYISAMSVILNKHLRNTCPHCQGDLDILDSVLADMEKLHGEGSVI